MTDFGYVEIYGRPVPVQITKVFYCHDEPVTWIVTDGETIWETHQRPYPDLSVFCGGFIPM